MHWITAVAALRRDREPGVLVTVLAVRGHAPREAGAKMVVGRSRCWGSVGGGNLEQSAVLRARELIAAGAREPETGTSSLTEHAPARHGVQCCGGEVSLLFEPLPPVPAVAIFGMGHVGTELARILARHDVELHLVDSREGFVEPGRLPTDDAVARVHRHHAVVPELVLGELPPGCHVLLMTHDHAEDAALCDAALRCGHLGSVGLIGSSAKWRRFEKKLAAEGHGPEALARITTPIGLPDIAGKDPATIAVSVAADLVRRFEQERAAGPAAVRTARRETASASLSEEAL
jgi:xanthine dehydrogenase accessory factor